MVAILLAASMLVVGCGTTDISEEEEEEIELTEEEKQEIMKNDQPWLMYEKTENINKDMETVTAWDVVNDIRIGWNLGNSLESHNSNRLRVEPPYKFEKCWGNPLTTQEMIDDVIAAGFNIIRVPVTWYCHIDPECMINEQWMDRVQEVVDYAYNRGVYVIINVHHEEANWSFPSYENEIEACYTGRRIWAQVAERFKDYDEHLIFEVQNEPRKKGTAVEWNNGDEEGREVVNRVNFACIEAIRNSGGSNPYRMLMVPDYAASSSTLALESWRKPEDDDRIIVSVHAYTPYEFAMLSGAGEQIEWNNNTAGIDGLKNDLKRLFIDKDIPVIIGEFGAVSRDDAIERRLEWADYYLSSFNEIGVPCVIWDNNNYSNSGERYGLYDRKNLCWPYPEYLEKLMEVSAQRVGEDAYIFSAEEYRLAHPVEEEVVEEGTGTEAGTEIETNTETGTEAGANTEAGAQTGA